MRKDKIILFLDIDGVLICKGEEQPRLEAVSSINKLIKIFDAYIVITSARRIGKSTEELQEKIEKYGILGIVVGKTKDAPIINRRGNDIYSYIKENGVQKYVVVDDVDPIQLIPPLDKSCVLHVPLGFRTGITRGMVDRFLENRII
ncbi:MAG: HAD domain-containing protein [Candidatus Paceibacterota bacterium]